MFSQNEKEYFRYLWEGFKEGISWNEIAVTVIELTIGYILLGWVGIILAVMFGYMTWRVASPAVYTGYTKEEPVYESKCVAGHKDCEICDKNGDFDYEKRSWYNIF